MRPRPRPHHILLFWSNLVETPAPVGPETPAAVDVQTPAPVVPDTPAPVVPDTPAPVDVQTPAPVAGSFHDDAPATSTGFEFVRCSEVITEDADQAAFFFTDEGGDLDWKVGARTRPCCC